MPLPNGLEFPPDYDPDDCIFLGIPCALVPHILGEISRMLQRSAWATDSDWEQGYQAILQVEASMTCGTNIAERLDRLIAALGFAAGLPSDDPNYDPDDNLRRLINQVEKYQSQVVSSLGYVTPDPPDPSGED